MKKLAIVTTHPIQYYAPWFKLLAERKKVRLKVFYTWEQSQTGEKFDPGFGKKVTWDIPLLEGYDYTFVQNISKEPGSHHFKGIINPTLIDEIKEWKPDAILIIGWNFQSHLKCMRYFHKKIPVLFRGDSTLLNQQPFIKKIIRRIFLSWVYAHVDYALYVGVHNKEYYKSNGLKEKQLVFAPHAIDNDRYEDKNGLFEKEAKAWRSELGIAEPDLVILFAGKFEPVKNAFTIADIADKIKNPDVKFVMVGNGMLEDELKSRVKEDKRFIFIGFQNQQKMPVVYRLSDVFILPSKSETWGLAINEAMACNRPVIVSNKVGCEADLVKNNVNGIVFTLGNIEPIVSFITKLIIEKGSAKRMGDKSKEIIKNYSFEEIVNAIEQLTNKS